MCGGSGARLWPASTRARPKQFVPLCGPRSSFQNTILRVRSITGAATPIVVAGVRHRELIVAELDALGAEATILLEPEARDSAAAMAAAAAWIARIDPDGVAVVVSADHEIPDSAAFAAAVLDAAAEARAGRIVTLGVKPTFPSTAFGYIRPGEGPGLVRPVAAFVEKPDQTRAEAYVAQGYLWNSGNFVVAARVLLDELAAFAPKVAAAAIEAAATAEVSGEVAVLGEAFRSAPKTSIDYAVMERTRQAAVVPVSFNWADIGSWDALLRIAPKDEAGNSIEPAGLVLDAEGSLVRAPADFSVAVIGVRDLAIVVHDRAVLVTSLAHNQTVKAAGEHFARKVPQAPSFADLKEAKAWLSQWLDARALPLWWSLGADHARGGFIESLDQDALAVEPMRRARVAARQTVVYATAGSAGWGGPWRAAVAHGLSALQSTFLRPDGLYRMTALRTGEPLDETACLYDQAFVLLALAKAHHAGAGIGEDEALALLGRMDVFRHEAGGFRETGVHTYQANAQMHLFEAALAWMEAGGAAAWRTLADEIASLALQRLFDAERGLIREFYDAAWRPAPGLEGRRVEPGHQFEWVWLLAQYRALGGQGPVEDAIARLYDSGLAGYDAARGVVIDALDDNLAPVEASARLWPQTEFLRAALVMRRPQDALRAAGAIRLYLDQPSTGQWRDRLSASGDFLPGPSPASSLYHISGACRLLTSLG